MDETRVATDDELRARDQTRGFVKRQAISHLRASSIGDAAGTHAFRLVAPR